MPIEKLIHRKASDYVDSFKPFSPVRPGQSHPGGIQYSQRAGDSLNQQ
jgi:hypothetical protein